ncbi:MAG: BglG family transcription antiterminator [Enterococcus sp.]
MNQMEMRKNALVYTLSNHRDFVTANELADVLNISTKSIYRLIKQINENTKDDVMIYSEKGRGFKLKRIKNNSISPSKSVSTITPIERRNKIMEELLFSAPYERDIEKLFEQFYVSENVRASDEKIIAEILKKYSLTLVKKNRALRIEGRESEIRKVIQELIQETKMIDLSQLENRQNEAFNKFDAEFVLQQLKEIEKKLTIVLPHPYNINLFSHIYIMISRFRKAGKHSFNYNMKLTDKEVELMEGEPELKDMSKLIVQNVEKYLCVALPEIESYFLFQYLISSRMQGEKEENKPFSAEVYEITYYLIENVESKLAIKLSNKQLVKNLEQHIKPLLNRLEHEIYVKNNLLEQIKFEYAQVFSTVAEVVDQLVVNKRIPLINEDEIGFLTLYFAQALEESKEKVKAVIMCTTGIGTSELLKVKISKKMSDIEIVEVISTRNIDLTIKKHPDLDLLITTIHLDNLVSLPTVTISAMLTVDDQERLHAAVEGIRNGK